MLDPSRTIADSLPHGFQWQATPSANSDEQLPAATTPVDTVGTDVVNRAQRLAAAIELLAMMDESASDMASAAMVAAGSIADSLAAKRVLVLWRDEKSERVSTHPLRIIADHRPENAQQSIQDDRHRLLQRMAIAAGEEIAIRSALTQWPPQHSDDSFALRVVGQFAQTLDASCVVGIPLSDSKGYTHGALIVIDPADQTAARWLDAIAPAVTCKLAAMRRLQPNRIESWIRRIAPLAQARRTLVATFIVVMLVLCVPLPFVVRTDIELKPVEHRFVAAPFDGPLESVRVRPGNTVHQGELLALINPRELDYELAGVRAELHQAIQEKKSHLAEHDFAASQIASLESDRLRLQAELLEYRRQNLEIRSPIDGVVVSGDLRQSEGMPMPRGETLFEIAPLGRMIVEVQVPEVDVAHVRPGMPVDFYVYALPARPMQGRIERVHPRAELRDHDNVFIAEVIVEDSQHVLRPGMRGAARIQSDRHPLGWNLFHRAYYAARRMLKW